MVHHIKTHFLTYAVTLLLLVTVLSSYYRFMVLNDYLVSYEGDCDAITENCFIGCDDDDCTEEYFYAVIERPAAKLKELCGNDITNCDIAYTCTNESTECSITYCDNSEDECSNLTNQ